MHGPIDYLLVGFDGNNFDGSVLRAIGEAVDKNIINLVALSVVSKDQEGVVTLLDITDVGDQYLVDFAQTHPLQNELVDNTDVEEVSELIEPNTTAGLLIIEHVWAKPLKKALIDANGYLIAEGRIHPDAAAELNTQGE